MDLTIANDLKTELEPNPCVTAMWIAGSVAEDCADEFSDIDIWLDIEDGNDKVVFDAIESFLKTKGKLDVIYSEGITPPFSHTAYHLAGTDPLHYIEITLHSRSKQFGVFDSLRKVKMVFEKEKVLFKPFDELAYKKMLVERKDFLIQQIIFGRQTVEKEIKRGQFPEAMHNYLFWQAEPIIELARIKLAPYKITYSLKHATRDLPQETVHEIESLYQVASLSDLTTKLDKVHVMLKKYR